MDTRVDEIAANIHRISTHVPQGPPGGLTYNQFLVRGDEALLFHTGVPRLFDAVRAAVATVMDPTEVRWISSCHASRPDEYGSVNQWLALAARAEVAHGQVGCFVCLFDTASRPPRALADGEVLDLGGARLRWLDTPHVPGPWESGVLFEEETRTLLCGDLFSRSGTTEPTTRTSIVPAAIAHEERMHGSAVTPATAPTLRRLAKLEPKTIAMMHGPAFVGDGAAELLALADYFEKALRAS
jgi:flavorubredoxin